ncbi:hypothetical protein FDI63_gp082 [Mycobacterium phage ChrisnMich]|uniref:Uncharacterized protein n=1 Tax=Mycobacterium phage ChrisnMich TaxID=1034130 RepID=G1BLD9_9CAUD|nr:hypothetical protein FDI63_gp082 [Mycobacterium phage ChrisnMich]AEJ94669.1 hypothetical protein CHRISNMICH_82 [Mycobacterium phage ChrisnMich]
MSADGTYWCPACTLTVDIARDDEGKRVWADHDDPRTGQRCSTSGQRNGWDDRP